MTSQYFHMDFSVPYVCYSLYILPLCIQYVLSLLLVCFSACFSVYDLIVLFGEDLPGFLSSPGELFCYDALF